MSTPEPGIGIARRMGRKKLWPDEMIAKFPAGTFDEIAALKDDGQDRTDFVREAVRRELERVKRLRKRAEAQND